MNLYTPSVSLSYEERTSITKNWFSAENLISDGKAKRKRAMLKRQTASTSLIEPTDVPVRNTAVSLNRRNALNESVCPFLTKSTLLTVRTIESRTAKYKILQYVSQ